MYQHEPVPEEGDMWWEAQDQDEEWCAQWDHEQAQFISALEKTPGGKLILEWYENAQEKPEQIDMLNILLGARVMTASNEECDELYLLSELIRVKLRWI